MKLEMPETPTWLRATVTAPLIGVDREAKVLRGYVVAQAGPFKTPGRGEFDEKSLKSIVTLMKKNKLGTKSRFAHPTLSDDGVGKLLGRAKNPVLDGDRVRADLHFDESAFNTPGGDLATYVMNVAESDPDAISSSLVLETEMVEQVEPKTGKPILDENGTPKPPLWRPSRIHASDIVDTGDAVDGLLSIDNLPDAIQRRGCELLNQMFEGQPREVVRARCLAWLERYFTLRYGEENHKPADIAAQSRRNRLLTRPRVVS